MGQVLHGSATTTEAIRRAIQHSQTSLKALSKRYGIDLRTVAKCKKRISVADQRTGPRDPHSTVLSPEEEAVVVAFRRHTLLPLNDCLYAFQATIPHLTRSSLHRCLQRHGISRLPEVDGDKPKRSRFKAYPLGYFYIDLAETHTAEGRLYLFVAIDRTTKFAFVELHEKATRQVAGDFLRHLGPSVRERGGADGGDAQPGAASRQRGGHPGRELPAQRQATSRPGGAPGPGEGAGIDQRWVRLQLAIQAKAGQISSGVDTIAEGTFCLSGNDTPAQIHGQS